MSFSDFCVERLTCSSSGYRRPEKPPDPTPPPKHIRGGYELPPTPIVTYITLPDEIALAPECELIEEGGEEAPEIQIEPRFVVTVMYEHLDQFLPDENKRAVYRSNASLRYGSL